jgi:(p)ppGpp synthase/HD superfamily hydrolase
MLNERALEHYEQAVVLLTTACAEGQDNETSHVFAHLASVAIQLAEFAVNNHPLIAGIDEDLVPDRQMTHQAPGGVWGAVPPASRPR